MLDILERIGASIAMLVIAILLAALALLAVPIILIDFAVAVIIFAITGDFPANPADDEVSMDSDMQ